LLCRFQFPKSKYSLRERERERDRERERERETFDLLASRYRKRPSVTPMKHCKITGLCIISGRFSGGNGKDKIVEFVTRTAVHIP
jgi:hypothetical protein